MITARHRDCRDRLTHENVIRISLLPNRLEERLFLDDEFVQCSFLSLSRSVPRNPSISFHLCSSFFLSPFAVTLSASSPPSLLSSRSDAV